MIFWPNNLSSFSAILQDLFFNNIRFFQLRSVTFALFFGIDCPLPGMANEKGIRLNSGAVPAAVCLIKKLFEPHATVPRRRDGKAIKRRASQNTCRDSLYYFLLSGLIAKVNCNSLLFIFSI